MTQDHTTAFRAEFSGPRPLASQLYWKAIVFQNFDGNNWTPQDLDLHSPDPPVFPGKIHTHTIFLEPHRSVWLMALDSPTKGPVWADLTSAHTLKSRRPVKQKIQYEVTSLVTTPFDTAHLTDATPATGVTNSIPDPVPGPGTILPSETAARIISGATTKNPRARALAKTIARTAETPTEKIQALLSYFKENQFAYTLNPPRAENHPIDAFLFEYKQGYCEHFASAFAFMMNVLDIPARVVGGYLGGEHNPYGNYLTIRQSYAHAWVEMFDPKTGWVRVDPTMAVAPERLETNPDGSSAALGSSAGRFSFTQKLRFALDAANMRWEAWFTGYSYFEQKAFLQKLGLGRWAEFAGTPLVMTLMALVALAGFSGVLFRLIKLNQERPDPVQQAYALFCRRLGRLGMTRLPHQGPVDYAKTSSRKRPDLKTPITTITDLYVQLRFQKTCPDTALAEFKGRIRKFNPNPVPPHSTPLSKDLTH
jgi:transglutaminase-like putative cysteine protease